MRRRFMNSHKTFDYSKYMTIEVLEDGYEVHFTRDVEYNLNGYKWVTLKAGLISPTLKKGDLLSLRCSLTPGETFGHFLGNDKAINLRGNILSLIFKDDINLDISHYYGVFRNTFSFFQGNNIVSVEKNFLPATVLADSCYESMFYNCANLTTAPELPATTLAYDCYREMFRNCTSLTTAPELPATTLKNYCYQSMFNGCTSLTTAPELPATTLADSCYSYMFYGCSSLTTAPELPATTLKIYCYQYMFKNCTKLNYIKMLATDISASNCLRGWVTSVVSTGTFVKNAAMTSLPTGMDGIPSGWTVVNDGVESGGGGLQFPITLVEGDNGELGKKFYQYVLEHGFDHEEVYVIHNGYVIQTYDWSTGINVIVNWEWEVVDATNGIGSPQYRSVELNETGYLTFEYD